MPRLPDRPAKGPSSSLPPKPTTSSSSTNTSTSTSTRRSPPPRRPLPPSPPPEQQQQAQERTLAGLLAYSGLLGTVATLISFVAPDVDLFGNFQLVPADIMLGLQLLLPACLLNVAIMLPDYSSWKVPAEPTLEAQQKMAEALLAWTANRKAAADAAASSAAPTAAAAAAGKLEPGTSSSTSSAAAGYSSSSSSPTSSSQEAGDPPQGLPQPAANTTSSSSSAGPGEQQARVAGPSPGASPPWLMDNPDPPLPLPLARCKDALLMAQGHYLSATPRVTLPWPMQIGVLLINCMAAELLYRSVLLQVSGGWLTDRILEAGAEDAFLAAAAHLPVLPTPHMTGQLAAIALLSGAWGVAVGRQVLRMSRRPSLAMASQGKVAAGKLMQDMQRLAATMPKQGQPPGPSQQQQQQQQPAQSEQQQPGSGSHLEAAADEPTSPSQDTQPSQAAPQGPAAATPAASTSGASPSQEAAKLALAADQSGPGSSSPRSGSSRSGRQGPGGPLPNTLGALALSQVVTGVRDLSQAAGLGLAFALTGNLAAPFVAAVVTDGLMALLQRHGQERSRQRSIAFAKHFASFTRVLRDVQRQQTLKQEQHASHSQQQPAAVQPLDGAASTQQQDSAQLGGPPFSAAHAHSTGAGCDDVLDAAVAAAAAAPDAAALHAAAAAAAASAEGPAAAAGSGPAGGSGPRMESTIQLLDQLVVDQLAEHAAAAGPHK